MTNELIVLGASGHGKVVAAAAMAAGWAVVGFADDDPGVLGQTRMGIRVAPLPYGEKNCSIALGIGDCGARRRAHLLLSENGMRIATVIHPRANVEPSAVLAEGVFVAAGAVVGVEARVGRGAVINTSASIDHECQVGEFAHVSPGAHLAGNVTIGDLAWIGIGACVREGLTVGEGSVVGAGSVVVKSIEPRVVAFGSPASIRWPLPGTGTH